MVGVGVGAEMVFCAIGDAGVGELVEHAASSVISRMRQSDCNPTKRFLLDDIAVPPIESKANDVERGLSIPMPSLLLCIIDLK